MTTSADRDRPSASVPVPADPAGIAERAVTGSRPAEVVETHTSTCVFVGDGVYKVKKPLDLGFLDFRTVGARERACADEVALNRRLAPDVYLGVAHLHDVPDGEDGTPPEPMVVMRRMPAECRLSTLISAGVDVTDELRRIAEVLVAFHRRCATGPAVDAAATARALQGLWDVTLEQLAPFAGRLLDEAALREVADAASRYLTGRSELFGQRIRQGWIRDGHGDLLADDIFCLDDGPRILDCLEFDVRLRVGDVLADVGFLAMDLERLGRPDLARVLLDAYARGSEERHPASLEHLYVAYRALVRCKVACLRADQADGTAAADASRTARGLLELSRAHLRAGRVRLLLVGGLPGSGKSTLAAGLAVADPAWTVLRSDVLRRELDPATRPAAVGHGPYSPERRASVYTALLARAGELLRLGGNVVLDASWSDQSSREAAAALADETGAELTAVWCTVDDDVAERRLAARTGDVSDADAGVRRALRAAAPPWPDAITLDTDRPAPDVLRAALIALEDLRRPTTTPGGTSCASSTSST